MRRTGIERGHRPAYERVVGRVLFFQIMSSFGCLSASIQNISSSCEKAPHGYSRSGAFYVLREEESRTNFYTNDCVLAGNSELA